MLEEIDTRNVKKLEANVYNSILFLPAKRSLVVEIDRIDRLDSYTIKRGQIHLLDGSISPLCSNICVACI